MADQDYQPIREATVSIDFEDGSRRTMTFLPRKCLGVKIEQQMGHPKTEYGDTVITFGSHPSSSGFTPAPGGGG